MAGITLDAGALIAYDRGNREMITWFKEARRRQTRVTVPVVAIAQAWRGPSNARLGQLLGASETEPFTEAAARLSGELCGRAGTSDIVDAAVVLSAATRGDAILTSDPNDLTHLAAFVGKPIRIIAV